MDELESSDILPIKQPKEGINYPVVGVLDTGIASICDRKTRISQKRKIRITQG
jgi:hypothetical protein